MSDCHEYIQRVCNVAANYICVHFENTYYVVYFERHCSDLTFTFRQNKSLFLFMPQFILEKDTLPSNTKDIDIRGPSDLELTCSYIPNKRLPGTVYTGIRTSCTSTLTMM